MTIKQWCDTCEGSGFVYEQHQIGVVGVGGTRDCPDCDGKGYNLVPESRLGHTPGFIPGPTLPELKIQTQQVGVKYDDGKLKYSLIPPYALQEVARNLTAGLTKYPERNNWSKVANAREKYLDALIRHLESYRRGNKFDKESTVENMHEMAAVAVNAMFLLEFDLNPNLVEVKE